MQMYLIFGEKSGANVNLLYWKESLYLMFADK